nr:LysR family transcriptional regulator [Pseudomonas sp.]
DLNDLFYFAKVVDEGGFSAAGRVLNVSKSHLSRRISLLEERLGLRLLQRSTRKLAPTQAGEVYLRYCRAIAQAAHDADESMLGLLAEPTGQVTISAPIGLAQTVFPLLLPGFLSQYPKVSVRLHITNEAVDLYRDQVDIAMRIREAMHADANLIARRFGTSELSLVASKAYLEHHGTPQTPADLADHATVSFAVTEPGPHDWRLYDSHGEHVVVRHQPRLLCGDLQILLEAIRQGQGIGLLPDALWRAADFDDTLIHVLPDWRLPEGIVYAAYASRRGMVPAVRVLLDYLADNLTAVLDGTKPFWLPAAGGAGTPHQDSSAEPENP